MTEVVLYIYDVTNSGSEKTNNTIVQINKIFKDGIGLGGIYPEYDLILVIEEPRSPSASKGDYAIGQEQLALITKDNDLTALQQYGGVKGLAHLLKTDLEKGIDEDDADILKRRNAFESNTYPRKQGRSFGIFLWEAWQNLALIILMVAVVASLALGIKTELEKGESIFTFARDMTIKSTKAMVQSASIPEDLGFWRSKLLWASRVLPMPLVALLIIGGVCSDVGSQASEYPAKALSILDFGSAMKVFLAKRLATTESHITWIGWHRRFKVI